MEASKLTVNPETLRFQPMAKGKKTKLRRQNVIDLIESKPYGTPLSLRDFMAVTQSSTSSAHSMIKSMIRNGSISQDEISPKKYAYRVNGSVTTKKFKEPVLLPASIAPPEANTQLPPPQYRPRPPP